MSKKAILLVSFGTTHLDTREKNHLALKKAMEQAFTDFEVREAYTSRMIIRILKKRHDLNIDTPAEALEKLKKEGFYEVYVQPTLFTNGIEYETILEDVKAFRESFETLSVGTSLLSSDLDYEELVKALDAAFQISNDPETAYVFMGHGSEHPINAAAYAALDYRMKHAGLSNAFIGTVEGYPDIDTVKADVQSYAPKKVKLIPLMIVAGDHAKNDMAGDEDSWKNLFEKDGYVTETVLHGMGELSGVRDIFIRHLRELM